MKKVRAIFLPTVTALLLVAGAANSHHAFAPVYDGGRTVTVEGVVTEFRLVNPHATISMDVTDDAGNVVQWSVELSGKLNLDDLVVRHYSLDQINQAYDDMDQGEVGRGAIVFD